MPKCRELMALFPTILPSVVRWLSGSTTQPTTSIDKKCIKSSLNDLCINQCHGFIITTISCMLYQCLFNWWAATLKWVTDLFGLETLRQDTEQCCRDYSIKVIQRLITKYSFKNVSYLLLQVLCFITNALTTTNYLTEKVIYFLV